MLIVKKGTLPTTPHTEFRFIQGGLALEEIHGSYGFGGPWARKMHVRKYPTEVKEEHQLAEFHFKPEAIENKGLQPFLIHTADIPYSSDALMARSCLLYGASTKSSMIKTEKSFPKNK